jgi:hypothetical protein
MCNGDCRFVGWRPIAIQETTQSSNLGIVQGKPSEFEACVKAPENPGAKEPRRLK